MPSPCFISVAQSMYDVLVRPAKLSFEDGVFSWAREVRLLAMVFPFAVRALRPAFRGCTLSAS